MKGNEQLGLGSVKYPQKGLIIGGKRMGWKRTYDGFEYRDEFSGRGIQMKHGGTGQWVPTHHLSYVTVSGKIYVVGYVGGEHRSFPLSAKQASQWKAPLCHHENYTKGRSRYRNYRG